MSMKKQTKNTSAVKTKVEKIVPEVKETVEKVVPEAKKAVEKATEKVKKATAKKEIKTTRNLYEICSVILCFLLYLVVFLWGYDLLDLLFHINQDLHCIVSIVLLIFFC